MNKAEALDIIREKSRGDDALIEALGCIIPELQESEDERMRRKCVELLDWCPDSHWVDKCTEWLCGLEIPEDKGEISDGYHTFNELYYYRMLYNAAFFNLLPQGMAHKSMRHHDGEECFGGGWFIVMADLPTGQISNHYETKYWDLFHIPEKEVADEWDGHTPQDAAERLHDYIVGYTDSEPKYKAGDILVNQNGYIRCILEVRGDKRDGEYYAIRYENKQDLGDPWRGSIEYVDRNWRPWTLEDVQPCDVLKNDACTFMVAKVRDNGTIVSECRSWDDGQFSSGLGVVSDTNIVPVTQSEKEVFLETMREHGYGV